MHLHPTTPVTIYALCDPDSGAPRYVGQTTLPLPRRLGAHLAKLSRSRSQRAQWLSGLRAVGKRPTISALEITDAARSDEREHAHIARLRAEGHALTNVPFAQPIRIFSTDAEQAQEVVVHDQMSHVTIREAADLLGVHMNTIRNRIKTNVYPAQKVLTAYGETYIIDRAAFLHVHPELLTPEQAEDSVLDLDPTNDPVSLAPARLRAALEPLVQPLVDELARSRAEAADAHERAGRAEGEKDALRTRALAAEEQVRHMEAHAAALERALAEREQRRPWWRFWERA